MDTSMMIKQSLNVFITVMCGFIKVPQIRKLYNEKTTEGLSFVNMLIELLWYEE